MAWFPVTHQFAIVFRAFKQGLQDYLKHFHIFILLAIPCAILSCLARFTNLLSQIMHFYFTIPTFIASAICILLIPIALYPYFTAGYINGCLNYKKEHLIYSKGFFILPDSRLAYIVAINALVLLAIAFLVTCNILMFAILAVSFFSSTQAAQALFEYKPTEPLMFFFVALTYTALQFNLIFLIQEKISVWQSVKKSVQFTRKILLAVPIVATTNYLVYIAPNLIFINPNWPIEISRFLITLLLFPWLSLTTINLYFLISSKSK